ncbi:MAG: DUF2815 family protein [Synergistaceae bacterium]|nr:DUF2815 family protein [Synergistaceae bacterium]
MKLAKAKAEAKALLQQQRATISGYLHRNRLLKTENLYEHEKYSTVIVFPMNDEKTVSNIENAMKATFEQNHGKLSENGVEISFADVIKPIREDYDIPNFYVLRAATTEKPNIVDAQREPINLTSEPVSGAKGRISVLFRASRIEGTPRIYAVLKNVQLIDNKNYLEDLNTFAVEDDFEEISEEEELE